MARGGPRPGSGRPRRDGLPPGSAPRKRASRAKVKVALPSGEAPVNGYSPSGVKSVDAPKDWPFGVAPDVAEKPSPPAAPESSEDFDPTLSPLDYLLRIVRDPKADQGRRIQAANIAAPYVHVKKGEGGKKAEKDDAAKRATSKFAPTLAPLKLVNAAKK